MISSACRPVGKVLLTSLRALTVALLCATASAQYSSRGPEVRVRPPPIPADAKDIAIKGERVCLRRRPDESGRVLLDCAVGLRGDDDRFYGLRVTDPAQVGAFSEMNTRVLVKGKLLSWTSGMYEEAGQIAYTSIEPLRDDPKPVAGTVMCLVPTTPGSGANEKCRRAVKTARGLYWGLESRSLDSVSSARGLEPGDRISLEAEILQLAPEDFESWMSSGASGRIEGVLKVHSLKRLPAQ